MTLLELSRTLADALTAAGLTAYSVFDPAQAPGVVVAAPSVTWDPATARTACGDITRGRIEVDLVVVGAGFAPEQIETMYTDAQTVIATLAAITAPFFTILDLRPGQTTDAPTYTVTAIA